MLTVVLATGGPLACVALLKTARRAESGTRTLRINARARWRLPPRAREPLARALRDADVQLGPETAFEAWGVGTLSLAVIAMSLSPAMVVPACIAGVVGAPVGLRLARTRRERRFASALPGALEQVGAELRGGGTVAGAVDRLAAAGGPVADDLRRVHVRTRLGLGLSDALEGWPTEHDTPEVRAAAGALAVASTLGGRAADAIEGLAASLRHRLDAAAEAHALSAQSRLSAVVVGVAPIGYLAFSGLVDPGSVTVLVGTGLGRVCLVLGLGLEGLAALWIRRILRSEG
jgi:tight adherence protein B